jgi:hypothetical protein
MVGSSIVDWVTGVAVGVMSRAFAQMTAQYVQRKKKAPVCCIELHIVQGRAVTIEVAM